jgi:hypothetical protein
MVAPCIAAIHACSDGDSDADIELPEGIFWKGQSSAPAAAIVEGHHLDAWLDESDDY